MRWARFLGITLLLGCGSGEPINDSDQGPDLREIVAEAGSPNVVIILADDLGWRDVGYNGSEIKTPHLDALASSGVQLERFYAHPTCSPTRAALMTGRSPARLGVVRPISKKNLEGLPRSERLLPEYFAAAGYQTAMVGKWHLGHMRSGFLPLARGFEHFYGNVTGGIGYWDKVEGGGFDWQRNGVTLREDGYSTRLLASEAVRLIEERDLERRLFLYAAFNAPHLPNEAPQETLDRFSYIDNPFRRKHAAMVSELDAGVGEIVDALKREGIHESTLLIFLSDNGGLSPEAVPPVFRIWSERLQGWFGKPLPVSMLEFIRENSLEGGSDNSPLRGGKATVFEGGVRVPGFVYWPGTLAPFKLESVVTVEDILPTLANLVGFMAAPGAPFDGASQWVSLEGGVASHRPNFLVTSQDGAEAWYEFPWKLVLPAAGPLELYRLDEDPTEAADLADAEPDRVSRMLADHSLHPRGRMINLPFYRIAWDADRFGGDEDREPWADVVVE